MGEVSNSSESIDWKSSDSTLQTRTSELYPKTATIKDQEGLCCPYEPLYGENVMHIGQLTNGIAALSNYRFLYQNGDVCYIISLGVIDTVEMKGSTAIQINCKDVQTFRCDFPTPGTCNEWLERLGKSITISKNLDGIFALAHFAWAAEDSCEVLPPYHTTLSSETNAELTAFRAEVERLNFDVDNGGQWRVCVANRDFELCPTYPRYLLVPSSISDDDLKDISKFRSSCRIPVVVWRHRTNGAIIGRCSQPKLGLFDNRSNIDESLFQSILDVSNVSCPPELRTSGKKLLIIDARSYGAALANRAKGGGCESSDYYPHCEIRFMNIANIHSVRKSSIKLRELCAMSEDEASWLAGLEATKWLQTMSNIFSAAVTVYKAVEEHGQPVVVHCSDGWDRTPQIVALAEILLDPYYRTIEGFQILVEREWLGFGHKFSSRCGFTDEANERCPVFLQWLDCIQNIHRQYPWAFEFSLGYLVKLAQHTYSNLFGTFLCNNVRERRNLNVAERTFSVWRILQQPEYRNHLYNANGNQTLCPAYGVRDLQVWRELYLGYSNAESFFSLAKGMAKMGGNLAPSLPFGMGMSPATSNHDNTGSQLSSSGSSSFGMLELPDQRSTQCANSEQVCKFMDPVDGLLRVRDDVQNELVRITLQNKTGGVALEQELILHNHQVSTASIPSDVSVHDEFVRFCQIWESLNEVPLPRRDWWRAIEALEQKQLITGIMKRDSRSEESLDKSCWRKGTALRRALRLRRRFLRSAESFDLNLLIFKGMILLPQMARSLWQSFGKLSGNREDYTSEDSSIDSDGSELKGEVNTKDSKDASEEVVPVDISAPTKHGENEPGEDFEDPSITLHRGPNGQNTFETH